jgi:hypothetical protein
LASFQTPVTVRELGYSARNPKERSAPIGALDGPCVATHCLTNHRLLRAAVFTAQMRFKLLVSDQIHTRW